MSLLAVVIQGWELTIKRTNCDRTWLVWDNGGLFVDDRLVTSRTDVCSTVVCCNVWGFLDFFVVFNDSDVTVCWFDFCLRPSAKVQGITWAVLVVLVVLHLVHFLIKRNLREPGFEPGTSRSTVSHSTNWAKETLLYKTAGLGPVLVDNCLFYFCPICPYYASLGPVQWWWRKW